MLPSPEQHKSYTVHLSPVFPLLLTLRGSMILFVFQWLQVLVAPVGAAQDSISSNIPTCTDHQYDWVSTRFVSLLDGPEPMLRC